MANSFDVLKAVRYANSLAFDVEADGLAISVSNDFHDFKRACEPLDRGPPYPLFDPDRSEVLEGNAFWIKCTSGDRIVHTQALRLLDLGEVTLTDHFERLKHLYEPPTRQVDHAKSDFALAELADTITGRVCYHGEIWIDSEFRGNQLILSLARLGITLAFLQWRPACIWGFTFDQTTMKGMTAQFGYWQISPYGIRWRDSNGDLVQDQWLCKASRSDILMMINSVGKIPRSRRAAPGEPQRPGNLRAAV